jgi:hypothetical protein
MGGFSGSVFLKTSEIYNPVACSGGVCADMTCVPPGEGGGQSTAF